MPHARLLHTHIAGECSHHEALRIGRHNAACHLIHAAIRRTAKGGGALHSAPDLILVAVDTGTLLETTADSLDSLPSSSRDPNTPPNDEHPPCEEDTSQDWLILHSPPRHDHRRHTDVSQELRYTQRVLSAAKSDAECTAAPRRIPEWILSHEEIQELYAAGHGTSPDLIYARGVPDSPSPDPTTFNKKLCTLIIIEIGFCRDLGCDTKLEAKTANYAPLLAALRRHWGHFDFVAFPIGHA